MSIELKSVKKKKKYKKEHNFEVFVMYFVYSLKVCIWINRLVQFIPLKTCAQNAMY